MCRLLVFIITDSCGIIFYLLQTRLLALTLNLLLLFPTAGLWCYMLFQLFVNESLSLRWKRVSSRGHLEHLFPSVGSWISGIHRGKMNHANMCEVWKFTVKACVATSRSIQTKIAQWGRLVGTLVGFCILSWVVRTGDYILIVFNHSFECFGSHSLQQSVINIWEETD